MSRLEIGDMVEFVGLPVSDLVRAGDQGTVMETYIGGLRNELVVRVQLPRRPEPITLYASNFKLAGGPW